MHKIHNFLLPFYGIFLGLFSGITTILFVTIGMPTKGIIGAILFPIIEEIIKLLWVLQFLRITASQNIKYDFNSIIFLGLMAGFGFRLSEMHIKSPTLANYLLGAIAHGSWLNLSLSSFYSPSSNQKRKLLLFLYSIFCHFGFNITIGGQFHRFTKYVSYPYLISSLYLFSVVFFISIIYKRIRCLLGIHTSYI